MTAIGLRGVSGSWSSRRGAQSTRRAGHYPKDTRPHGADPGHRAESSSDPPWPLLTMSCDLWESTVAPTVPPGVHAWCTSPLSAWAGPSVWSVMSEARRGDLMNTSFQHRRSGLLLLSLGEASGHPTWQRTEGAPPATPAITHSSLGRPPSRAFGRDCSLLRLCGGSSPGVPASLTHTHWDRIHAGSLKLPALRGH